MEPWLISHKASHAYAVERLEEAVEKVRQAGGWLGILPETSDHVAELLTEITASLASVLRSVDRPTVLEDFDSDAKTDAAMAEFIADPAVERAKAKAEPKVFKFDATGDIDA